MVDVDMVAVLIDCIPVVHSCDLWANLLGDKSGRWVNEAKLQLRQTNSEIF